jgi:glycosyltransferase involved in cell wall biosynthesis
MQPVNFSVIVPVYNGEKYISECIASVLPQLGSGDELLIHDDGSEDGTRKLLSKWPVKLNVSMGPNEGVSVARNRCAERAKGEYLIFLDADDLLRRSALSIFRNHFIEKRTSCALTPILFFEENLNHPKNTFYGDAFSVENDPLDLFLKLTPPAASLLVSRELFQKVGGFCFSMGHSEEFDLVIRLCEAGANWSFISEVVRLNRVHLGPRASHNQKLCSWRAITVLHSIYRKRYNLSLEKHHREDLFCAARDGGRILFRIGERKLSKVALSFVDQLVQIGWSKEDSAYDRLSRRLGYFRAERIREWLNMILGKNSWGQKKA